MKLTTTTTPLLNHQPIIVTNLKALNAIKLIKRYFTKTELLQLITSNVLSILYYNSEIWHLPNIKSNLKQNLLSVSANAIKISMFYPDPMYAIPSIFVILSVGFLLIE